MRVFLLFGAYLCLLTAGSIYAQDQKLKHEFNSPDDKACAESAIQSAELVPHFDKKAATGLLVKSFEAGSQWDKRGFKKGDVVMSIGSTPTTDVFTTLLLTSGICKNQEAIKVRRGKKEVVLPPSKN